MILSVHHIAIICSDIQRSKKFYTEVFGFELIREVYRNEKQSFKIDLSLQGTYCIELFSFSNAPTRPSRPEALGLRHIAFAVTQLENEITRITKMGYLCEDIRVDEYTGKKFTFLSDPDLLPIELYEN